MGYLQYVDALCKDLGINPRRKSNIIAEYVSPYKPEDYNGIDEEYFAQKRISSTSKAKNAESQLSRLLVLCLAGVSTSIVLLRWILSTI